MRSVAATIGWPVFALAMAAGVISVLAQQPGALTLQYRMKPGDVFDYRTRMTWNFDAGQTHNTEVLEGRELVVVLAQPSSPGQVRLAIVPAGIVIRDQRVHGETHTAIAARGSTRPWDHYDRSAYRVRDIAAIIGAPSAIGLSRIVQLRANGALAASELPGFGLRHAGLFQLLGERIQSLSLPAQPFLEFPETGVTPDASWTPVTRGGGPTYTAAGYADVAGGRAIEIKASLASPDRKAVLGGSVWSDPVRGVVVREKLAFDCVRSDGSDDWKTHETLESDLARTVSLGPEDLAERGRADGAGGEVEEGAARSEPALRPSADFCREAVKPHRREPHGHDAPRRRTA